MRKRKPFFFALILICTLSLEACRKAPEASEQPAAPDGIPKQEAAAGNPGQTDGAGAAESPAPAPEAVPAPETSPSQDSAAAGDVGASGITGEEAENIALEHAGVAREDLTYIRTNLDIDDGVQEYEVEFYVGNKEYEYHIEAATGGIRTYDFEIKNDSYHHSDRHHGTNAQGASSGITVEEAENIALAQVPGADSSHIRIETDYDDGVLIYEGKIIYNEMEYEFEIDAATGTLLKWDAESVFD